MARRISCDLQNNFSIVLKVFSLSLLNINEVNNPSAAENLKEVWLEIGRKNPWIREAYDPPFNAESFTGEAACTDVQDLVRKLLQGNWCLGTTCYFEDICFINQVEAGDEWLTIKGKTPFESITFRTPYESYEEAEKRAFETIERIRKATEEQCRKLEY